MNQKSLILIIVAIVVIAAGVWWWFGTDRSGDQGDAHLLRGAVTSVDRANQAFVLTVTEEIEVNGSVDIQDTNYTVKWDNETEFLLFSDSNAVESNSATRVQSGELQRDKSVDVETEESSGSERTAERIVIYPGFATAEIVE